METRLPCSFSLWVPPEALLSDFPCQESVSQNAHSPVHMIWCKMSHGVPDVRWIACRAVDFLIMEGQNLSAVAPSFAPFGGALCSARQAWMLIAAMVMLPTVYLRDLSLLAYLSAAGVLTSAMLTCLVGTLAGEHGK